VKNMSSDSITIIGAGITGLACAFEAVYQFPDGKIAVFDAGPNPQTLNNFYHEFGASFSGSKTRQLSVGESSSWHSSDMSEKILIPLEEGGWDGLPNRRLSGNEIKWRERMIQSCAPEILMRNVEVVHEINRLGLDRWIDLSKEFPNVFEFLDSEWKMSFICNSEDDMDMSFRSEEVLNPGKVTQTLFENEFSAVLSSQLRNAGMHGVYNSYGNAIAFKPLCDSLITYLVDRGVDFNWNKTISSKNDVLSNTDAGNIVFTGGVQSDPFNYLAENELLLQGVAGCWMAITNPGFDHAFKLEEFPVITQMGCTPYVDQNGVEMLMVAGADCWVGESDYQESSRIAETMMQQMQEIVGGIFGLDLSDGGKDLFDKSVCIRPALPDGVPRFGYLNTINDSHHVHTIIGGVGGGAVQAFYGSDLVLQGLK
jgi:glycine/D-amino acid oxidase-like deaminating enzyme